MNDINEIHINQGGDSTEVLTRVLMSIERQPGQTVIIFTAGRAYKVKVEAFDHDGVLIVPAPHNAR